MDVLNNRRVLVALAVLACVILAACQDQSKAPSSQAQAFRTEVNGHLAKARDRLLQEPGLGDPAKTAPVMRALVQEACRVEKNMPYGLIIIGRDGRVVSGCFTDSKAPDGVVIVPPGQNYAEFQAIKKVFNQGKSAQFATFDQEGKYLAVCTPLKKEGGFKGALCMGLAAGWVKKQKGVSEEEFLALDFN